MAHTTVLSSFIGSRVCRSVAVSGVVLVVINVNLSKLYLDRMKCGGTRVQLGLAEK